MPLVASEAAALDPGEIYGEGRSREASLFSQAAVKLRGSPRASGLSASEKLQERVGLVWLRRAREI